MQRSTGPTTDATSGTPRRHRIRRPLAIAATALLVSGLGACSSDGTDDDSPPADSGTVVPDDPVGVGGGVPVDNLRPEVADEEQQQLDDVDGDGQPEP